MALVTLAKSNIVYSFDRLKRVGPAACGKVDASKDKEESINLARCSTYLTRVNATNDRLHWLQLGPTFWGPARQARREWHTKASLAHLCTCFVF